MSKYNQGTISFNDNETKIAFVRLQEDKAEARYKGLKVYSDLELVVGYSRLVFSNNYIMDQVGYSRQTISKIHNGKATYRQAVNYIITMSDKLKALGIVI